MVHHVTTKQLTKYGLWVYIEFSVYGFYMLGCFSIFIRTFFFSLLREEQIEKFICEKYHTIINEVTKRKKKYNHKVNRLLTS